MPPSWGAEICHRWYRVDGAARCGSGVRVKRTNHKLEFVVTKVTPHRTGAYGREWPL